MSKLTRREVLAGASILALPIIGQAQEAGAKKLKVVVVGGHPDDPESGCGGTILRLAEAGHEVVVMYLTRGEAGIAGKSHEEAAGIRTREAQEACRILGARAVFVGQIDGSTEINSQRHDAFAKMLMAEKPDLVFAHWPIDTHRDHRAASMMAFDAWSRARKSFALYFFEVNAGSQTQIFRPTHYVDVTNVEEKKRAACMAHQSQQPEGFYGIHTVMMQFRGREHGCKMAEGFVHHNQSKVVDLPRG